MTDQRYLLLSDKLLGEEHIPAAFLNGANKGTSQGLKPKEASYAHVFLLWEC